MGAHVEPFLDPGERSMMSFTAKIGPTPWLPMVLAVLAGTGAYLVAPALPVTIAGFRIYAAVVALLATLTLANLALYRARVISVTNCSIVTLTADRLNGTPTGVRARVARTTQIGPARGIHARTEIEGEKMWVPIRWRALLDVSDRGRPREARVPDLASTETERQIDIDVREPALDLDAPTTPDPKPTNLRST